MNKALNIIKEAQSKGVKLELEEGSLVLRSENENIDEALLLDIKSNKELIVEHLNKFDVTDNSYKQFDKDEIKPFDRERADGWLDEQDWDKEIYRDIETSEVAQINVHDITHYLSDPKVYLDIFKTMDDNFEPKDDELVGKAYKYLEYFALVIGKAKQ